MTRALALAVVLTGCASGSSPAVVDSQVGGHDAPVVDAPVVTTNDGRQQVDAGPIVDAPVVVDAPPHIDAAAPDAPHVDAAPPDACVPQNTQLLANPAFDLTPAGTGWTETSPAGFELVGAFVNPEQTAPFSAFLGGETGFGVVTDFLSQDITIPAGTTKLELTGFYAVLTDEGSTVFDTGGVDLIQTNGSPIENVLSLSNATPVSSWTAFDHVFANPAALSGKTIRLRMTSTNDDTLQTSFLFDTFALTATHGCP